MVARGWSDAQKRAYVIADNQLALNAGWDREFLGLSITLSRRRTKAGDVDYELSADELQRRELARLSDAVLCERSLVERRRRERLSQP